MSYIIEDRISKIFLSGYTMDKRRKFQHSSSTWEGWRFCDELITNVITFDKRRDALRIVKQLEKDFAANGWSASQIKFAVYRVKPMQVFKIVG